MINKEPRNKEYIMIIANDLEKEPYGIESAYAVLKFRLKNNIWAFHKRTKCKYYIKKGSKLVFYIAGKRKNSQNFVAEAEVKDYINLFPKKDISRYVKIPNWYFDTPEYKIELKNIKWFNNFVNIYDIMDKLNIFSKKKTNKWGVFLQGGASRISINDYNLIKRKSI